MFKSRAGDGSNNVCGENLKRIRKQCVPKMSQRALAEKLQLNGMDVDKNAIQRIECGKRFVTDIELVIISQTLNVSLNKLIFYKE